MSTRDFVLAQDDGARKEPVRVVVVQEDERPAVELYDDEMVMSFPHLVVRELIALIGISLVLVLIAVLFDAPLEELANPQKTPNPAKAPWYFLGLQELLHYYPPLVSGVLLPGLILVSLAVIPYFEINLKRESIWNQDRQKRLGYIAFGTVIACLVFAFTGAHPMWPVIVPTLIIGCLMGLPGLVLSSHGFIAWLETRSFAFWIFTWFVVCAVSLTIVGTFFRGPGWAFTLPWRDGIY